MAAQMLPSSADAAQQIAAQGVGETMAMMAVAAKERPAAVHVCSPRLGLIAGLLHQLDLFALRLFVSA